MRALLLQLDGKIPNIALMRLSTHLRERGHEVEFRRAANASAIERGLWDRFDEVYGSLIFERTRPIAERLRAIRPDAVLGGYDKAIPWDEWVAANFQPRALRRRTSEPVLPGM